MGGPMDWPLAVVLVAMLAFIAFCIWSARPRR